MPYYTSNIKVDLTDAVENKELIQAGDYLMLDKCDNEVTIKLDSYKNHSIRMKRKDVIRAVFKKIYVTAPAGSDAYFKFMGSTDDSVKIEPATRVISDILHDRTSYHESIALKNNFFGGWNLEGVVNNYPNVALWNPLNSGVHGILYHLRGVLDSANNGDHIHLHSITSIENWDLGLNGVNKFLGEAPAKLEIYYRNYTSELGDHISEEPRPLYTATEFLRGDSAIIVPENHGILVSGGALNQDISGYFEWKEIPKGDYHVEEQEK